MRNILKSLLVALLAPALVLAQDNISQSTGIIGNGRLLGAQTYDGQTTVGILGIDSSGNTTIQSLSGSSVSIPGTMSLTGAATLSGDLINSTALKGVVLGASSRAANVTTATTAAVPLYVSVPGNVGSTAAFIATANATGGVTLDLFKTRATTGAATTIVNSGDSAGQIKFWGANGTTYDTAAAIQATIDTTPGASNDMPGALTFYTTPNASSSLAQVLKLGNDKAATFAGALTSTATGTLGWTVVAAANQACTTTCTNACVIGIDTLGTGGFLDCATATSDFCLCAGAS